jgi:NADH:ubiquinone oxidoreductase subunit K
MTNPMLDIGLTHFVLLSLLVMAAGVATVLTKRNAIGILIGVELILNAAALNFVAFNHYAWPAVAGSEAASIEGIVFAVFIVVLAAAEAAIALAIFLNFYNTFGSIDVEKAAALKG